MVANSGHVLQIDTSGLSTTASAEILAAVVTALVNVNNAVVAAAGNSTALSQISAATAVIANKLAAVVADPTKLADFQVRPLTTWPDLHFRVLITSWEFCGHCIREKCALEGPQ